MVSVWHCVFLLLPSLGCLSITLQNNVQSLTLEDFSLQSPQTNGYILPLPFSKVKKYMFSVGLFFYSCILDYRGATVKAINAIFNEVVK